MRALRVARMMMGRNLGGGRGGRAAPEEDLAGHQVHPEEGRGHDVSVLLFLPDTARG